jgi:site-specific DNA recombinase
MSSDSIKAEAPAEQGKRCGIYLRVSTAKQAAEGLSLDAQEQTAREVAQGRGATSIDVYTDAAVKGTQDSRPGLDAMMAGVAAGQLDVVIVYKIDRLGRTQRQLHRNAGLLQDRGVVLVAFGDNIDTSTAQGRMMLGMLGIVAEIETTNISERVLSVQAQRREQGRHAGRGKYGYSKAKGVLTADRPDEARIVERIHAELHAGVPQAEIARGLGRDGVLTATGKGRWWQSNVQKILRDPTYAGLNDAGERCACGHKALISMETWERTQSLLGDGHTGRRPSSMVFRKGMLRCGLCGESMTPRSDLGGYICVRRHRAGVEECAMPIVSGELVDGSVLTHFQSVGLSVADMCAEMQVARDRQLAEARERLHEAEHAELTNVERTTRIKRDYMEGVIEGADWKAMNVALVAEHPALVAQSMECRARLAELENTHSDIEQDVLEQLAGIRAAIASEVGSQESLQSLRAALLALFEGFTLHNVRLGSDGLPELIHGELNPPGWVIEPHVRPEAIAKRSPTGRGVELHKLTLGLDRNKEPASWLGW